MAVTLVDGSEVVLPSLMAGVIFPVRARRVAVKGTTATGITGPT
ncbi:spike base protein, RCAP_Rcc01079 family [Tranquillimonas rosea]